MKSTRSSNLINENYKSKNKEDNLLEQYKIFVESSEKISLKRMSSNKFYLALNSALLGLSGYISFNGKNYFLLILSLIGIFLCFSWMANISAHRNLNSAKFKIIHELEEHLPARIYKTEDKYLNSYYKITSLEKYAPILFILVYIVIVAFILIDIFIPL